jgi:hypothetical protein
MPIPSDTVVGTTLSYDAARRLAWSVQAGVGLVLLLLGFGWVLVPATVPIAPAAVLIGYVVLARISASTAQQSSATIQRVAVACGVVSAVVLIRALVIQYFGRTANNAIMVAIVFVLWLIPGVVAAARTGRIRDAAMASTLSAQIGSLANVGFILGSYYVLRGTTFQEQFFRTEGTYEDFARSGIGDFRTFVMGDLFGGAFFHLLLGGLAGALLGTIGGGFMVRVNRMIKTDRLPNKQMEPTRR